MEKPSSRSARRVRAQGGYDLGGIREYLRERGLGTDYVLYSSYPALVDALVAGHIDIAWNTPLAYLQARERLGGQCLVLGMRDSDVNFTTVFLTRTDSPIHSLIDLKGKRFALASRDSSHAAILGGPPPLGSAASNR